jgi:hypothetical protein
MVTGIRTHYTKTEVGESFDVWYLLIEDADVATNLEIEIPGIQVSEAILKN